jgi:hypothetical protein
LFNPYSQQLVSYDAGTASVLEASDVPNYLYYQFDEMSDVYTAGNSITNGFEVLRIHGRSIETLHHMPANVGIFPLATDGLDFFFIVSTYDPEGAKIESGVAKMGPDQQLVPYSHVAGNIAYGALLGGRLYYTAYQEESDCYDIWSVDGKDARATPAAERTCVPGGPLYSHGGEILWPDARGLIRGAGGEFECHGECYFADHPSVMLDLHANADGDVELAVADGNNGEVLDTVDGVVGFEIGDSRVRVYREGSIVDVAVIE